MENANLFSFEDILSLTRRGRSARAPNDWPTRLALAKAKAFDTRQRQDKTTGGAERDRTADPLLAKQVLSQLSYSPDTLRSSAKPSNPSRHPTGLSETTPVPGGPSGAQRQSRDSVRTKYGGPGKT